MRHNVPEHFRVSFPIDRGLYAVSKMNFVQSYLWFFVTILFILEVFSVREGDRCDHTHDSSVANPNNCASYFWCSENDVFTTIFCPDALYFSAMTGNCITAKGCIQQ